MIAVSFLPFWIYVHAINGGVGVFMIACVMYCLRSLDILVRYVLVLYGFHWNFCGIGWWRYTSAMSRMIGLQSYTLSAYPYFSTEF